MSCTQRVFLRLRGTREPSLPICQKGMERRGCRNSQRLRIPTTHPKPIACRRRACSRCAGHTHPRSTIQALSLRRTEMRRAKGSISLDHTLEKEIRSGLSQSKSYSVRQRSGRYSSTLRSSDTRAKQKELCPQTAIILLGADRIEARFLAL